MGQVRSPTVLRFVRQGGLQVGPGFGGSRGRYLDALAENEWNVAAGVALGESSACAVCCTQRADLRFNQE